MMKAKVVKRTLIFIVLVSLQSSAFSMDKITQTECFFLVKPALNDFINLSEKIPIEGSGFKGECDLHYSEADAREWHLDKSSVLILYENGWIDKKIGNFIYLHKDQKGNFTAFWNGGGYSLHAHNSLNYRPFNKSSVGKLQCWESKVTQICFNENFLNNY